MSEKTEKRKLGDLGERAAARYLFFRGYRILERNWFFYKKEADIIAKRGKTLVICEVKTRMRAVGGYSPFGTPKDAVTPKKQRNLITLAKAYAKKIEWPHDVRIDIIEVYTEYSPKKRVRVRKINHLKSPF